MVKDIYQYNEMTRYHKELEEKRYRRAISPMKDFKKKGEKPWGVKCMVYGCGFEWYKGSPMTDKELKGHRCIHFDNPALEKPKDCKHNFIWNNRKHEACHYCGYKQNPTKPIGDKRGWVEEWKSINENFNRPIGSRHWLLRQGRVEKDEIKFIRSLVARTKKDMVEEIEKDFGRDDEEFDHYYTPVRDWEKLKKRLLK